VGVDLKAVLRQSLVLDATVNPDFSQVESDEPQVTVNRRFEVFFPEKRPFFIENASYFETPIRLLFTRRVVDPRAGLRLTGKTGPYAIGAFMADDQTGSATVSFARISRDLGGESNLGLVMSRRALAGRSNTVTGVDGQWRLGPNWLASAQAVTSATSTEDRRLAGPAYNAALRRAGRHLVYSVAYDDLSPGFRADSGFIERVDVRQLTQNATLRLRPGRPWLIDYGPDLVLQRLWAHDGRPLDTVGSATFTIDAAGPTAFSVAYTGRSELLRPAEVPGLVDALRFDDHATTVSVRSYAVRRLSFRGAWTWGDAINLAPAAGRPLATAASTLLDAGLTWRPAAAVGLELAVLQTSLAEPGIGERGVIFRDRILRTKATYQMLRALSVRGIAQYESVAAEATRSSLAPRRSLLLDLLAAYVPQPGTAVYVGYGDSLQGPQETLPGRWVSASRQFFLKLSVRKPL
jgi:hypothetical protein